LPSSGPAPGPLCPSSQSLWHPPLLRARPFRGARAFLVEAACHERIDRPAFAAVRIKDYLYVSYKSGDRELLKLVLSWRWPTVRATESAQCRRASMIIDNLRRR
jgi:hypothetical protein